MRVDGAGQWAPVVVVVVVVVGIHLTWAFTSLLSS